MKRIQDRVAALELRAGLGDLDLVDLAHGLGQQFVHAQLQFAQLVRAHPAVVVAQEQPLGELQGREGAQVGDGGGHTVATLDVQFQGIDREERDDQQDDEDG